MKDMKIYANKFSIITMWLAPYFGVYFFMATALYLMLGINIGVILLISSALSHLVWVSCKEKWRLHAKDLGLSQEEIEEIENKYHVSC